MLLQDFVDSALAFSDRVASHEGITTRLSDTILADSLGTLIRAARDGAADTVPIDTQGRVKREDFLVIAAALEAAAQALLARHDRLAFDLARHLLPSTPPSG